ncbi:sugar ABC transporter ATP-binding protein [Nocardia sp. NPDC004722]
MEAAVRSGTHLLEMRGIVKEFSGVRALDGIDLEVRAGEVHCLLGQNGAGKSTLIKVLAGVHQPDAGELLWEGESVRLPDPQTSMDRGIASIYQELDLVDGLSVAENIYLGHEPARWGFTRRSAADRATTQLLGRLGHADIAPTTLVGGLPAAGKQIVSMARALSRSARLIVMDEPSAVLGAGEVDRLFAVIRDLTADGVAVVYISHRLEEIRAIGDRVTVLKDGRTVASGLAVEEVSTAEIVSLMTGRSIDYVFPPRPATDGSAEPVLVVDRLGYQGRFDEVSFAVRPGEVVGLAGLVGSGRSEILETIYGARRASTGTITVAGAKVRAGSVPAAVAAGVGLCPEERKSQALFLDESVTRNISAANLAKFSSAGFLDRGAEARAAHDLVADLDVRPSDPARQVRTLSGGNQQKVVLARWLLRECRVLLLDEPTRGVDVGARAEIYTLIRDLVANGIGVVVVSSEIEEVIGLSDRLLVIREGRVVFDGPSVDIDEHRVLGLVMEGEVA